MKKPIKTANTIPWDPYMTWTYSDPEQVAYWNKEIDKRLNAERDKLIRGQYEQEPTPIEYMVSHYYKGTLSGMTIETKVPVEGDLNSNTEWIVDYVVYPSRHAPIAKVYWKKHA